MKKEKRSEDFLSQIRPVIPAAQVCHLVQQNCIQFDGREFLQTPRRKNDRWFKEADRCGGADPFGSADGHEPGRAKLSQRVAQKRIETGRIYNLTTLPQAAQLPKTKTD